ncbi:MAG: histidine kinase dimerization/phospho-acceptor domain-containing protein, partial [Bacillota bacterium]
MFQSLRGKVILGYLLLATLILLISAFSASNISRLTGSINKIMAENYWSVTAAERMIMALERQDSAVLLYLHGVEEEMISEFLTSQSEFTKWLGRAEDNVTLPNEGDLVERIDREYSTYIKAFGVMRTMEPEDRLAFYLNDMFPVLRSIEEEVGNLLRINHESMLEARDDANQMGRRVVFSTLLTGLAALLLAAGASLYISSLIIKPTRELTDLISSIQPGNVGHLKAAEKPDELGALAREVNEMIARLRTYDERVIAQLQSQKERSQAVVESITDGILVVDEQYNIQMANQKARELFSMPYPLQEGHLLEQITDERVFEAIKRSMAERETVELHGPEERWVARDGRDRRYYELAVSLVTRSDGTVSGAVANFRDVTHYHEVEELKTDFISTVTHEFRTPLTSLAMNAALLTEQVEEGEISSGGEEVMEVVSEMKMDTERLLDLVSDLLDLSRLESGRVSIDMEDVRVEDLVKEAVRPFWKQAEEAGITLTVGDMGGIRRVVADPTKIAWVISNLVGNALRYTDSGGTVTIRAEERGTRVAVSVSDTGIGIP